MANPRTTYEDNDDAINSESATLTSPEEKNTLGEPCEDETAPPSVVEVEELLKKTPIAPVAVAARSTRLSTDEYYEVCYKPYNEALAKAKEKHDQTTDARKTGKGKIAKTSRKETDKLFAKLPNIRIECSKRMFDYMNRSSTIFNEVKFDLHGQHADDAKWFVKRHLAFAAHHGTVKRFNIVTGYGSGDHPASINKKNISKLLKEENILCPEADNNPGMLVVDVANLRKLSFMDRDGYLI